MDRVMRVLGPSKHQCKTLFRAVPAQASKLRRAQLAPDRVFHADAPPPGYKVAGHLKSAKSCDASGLTTLPVWIS